MHPDAFGIFGLQVHWYGVMMALGFLLCVLNALWVGRLAGKSADFVSDLLCWAMISGVVGARAWYVAANWRAEFADRPVSVLYVHEGGLVYYGGLLFAIATIAAIGLVRKQSILGLFDIVAAGLPLAHAMGRIGCFMNGCCYGRLSSGPLGVRFPLTSAAGWHHYKAGLLTNEKVVSLMFQLRQELLAESDFEGKLAALVRDKVVFPAEARSLPVHPVQLYEAALDIVSYLVLAWLVRRRAGRGIVSCVCVMAYGTVRFTTEFFRGDERAVAGSLTFAQVVSICIFTAGLVTLLWLRANERKRNPRAA